MSRSLSLLVVSALILTLLPTSAAAQADTAPPALVRDIHPGAWGSGSEPSRGVALGDRVFFSAESPASGRELWASDGTPEGTRLVADVLPGPSYSDPQLLTPLGSQVFFTASDGGVHPIEGITQRELWASDGTAAGTRRVYAFAGKPLRTIVALSRLNSQLLFFVDTYGGGITLWRSDGTAAGTAVVTPTLFDRTARVVPLTTLGGFLYVVAIEPLGQFQTRLALWRSDGTAAGTTLVRRLIDQIQDAYPWIKTLGVQAGRIVFVVRPTHQAQLWQSDGSAAGTTAVDLGEGATLRDAELLGDWTIAAVELADRQVELRRDGEAFATFSAADGAELLDLTPASGQAFFSAGGPDGAELWASDGTALGTRQVVDLNPGPASSTPSPLATIGPRLFFQAFEPGEGHELWSSDGTAAGTARLSAFQPDEPDQLFLSPLGTLEGKLLFSAEFDPLGSEPWVSDGTPQGTRLLADIDPAIFPRSASPDCIAAIGERVIVMANDGVHGREPWVSDGTPEGTRLLIDLTPGQDIFDTGCPNPQQLGAGYLFDGPRRSDEPTTLYTTDGTPAGTRPLLTLPADAQSWVVYGQQIAVAVDPTWNDNTFDLWLSDAGATTIRKVNTLEGYPQQFQVHNGRLYLLTRVALSDRLSLIDESGSATPIYEAAGGMIAQLTAHAGALFFTDGRTLYRSGGTTAGATALITLGDIIALTSLGDRLLILNITDASAVALWSSDGTAAGTQLVREIPLDGGYVSRFAVAGGLAYFHTAQLWRSDGSAAGTFAVTDRLDISEQIPVGDRLIFFAGAQLSGRRDLWASGGTRQTTRVLFHHAPSAAWEDPPRELTLAGPRVFFRMGEPTHGSELWSMGANLQPPPLVPRVWLPAAGR